MRCYHCQSQVTESIITDEREKKGEMIFSSICTACNTRYEAQLVTISIVAQQIGNEKSLKLVKPCYNCGQLYPEEEEHSCSLISA